MLGSFISNIATSVKELGTDIKAQEEINALEIGDGSQDLNIIFNVLSQYSKHLINFKVSLDLSKELIMHFCEMYHMDNDRTHMLLSELEQSC